MQLIGAAQRILVIKQLIGAVRNGPSQVAAGLGCHAGAQSFSSCLGLAIIGLAGEREGAVKASKFQACQNSSIPDELLV